MKTQTLCRKLLTFLQGFYFQVYATGGRAVLPFTGHLYHSIYVTIQKNFLLTVLQLGRMTYCYYLRHLFDRKTQREENCHVLVGSPNACSCSWPGPKLGVTNSVQVLWEYAHSIHYGCIPGSASAGRRNQRRNCLLHRNVPTRNVEVTATGSKACLKGMGYSSVFPHLDRYLAPGRYH